MTLQFKPNVPNFAASVSGVDLCQPISDETVEEIRQGLADYAVLVFHDQPMTADQHASFTKRLGPIDKGLLLGSKKKKRLGNPDVIDLANVDLDGKVIEKSNARNTSFIANQFWHSDSSFKNPAAKYSLLCSIDVPSEGEGGETEFTDLRAAYDGLNDSMKAKVDNLVAEHWAFHSRNLLGGGDYTQGEMDALPPVHWPIVHTIPESQRKSLYIGIHTREIEGMMTAEARMLLSDLLEHATQRQYVYSHVWKNNDIVMWDNQCTLHRGRSYDLTQRRELRRCTTEVAAA